VSRLAATFSELRAKSESALVLFVTAGDPNLDDLPLILEALSQGGADIIEIGLPFSDPIADGPTIQASSQRALDRGINSSVVFESLSNFNGPPLVLMGYMNSILRRGYDGFAEAARNAGINASIVCDLTPDEAGDWINASQKRGLDNIFLVAPTSTDARLDEVCSKATGFVYAVSRTGVTGAATDVASSAEELVKRVRARTELPVCVGFGISTPDQVREVCRYADGAIIGSWLVEFLHQNWKGGQGRQELVDAVSKLKQATR